MVILMVCSYFGVICQSGSSSKDLQFLVLDRVEVCPLELNSSIRLLSKGQATALIIRELWTLTQFLAAITQDNDPELLGNKLQTMATIRITTRTVTEEVNLLEIFNKLIYISIFSGNPTAGSPQSGSGNKDSNYGSKT